MLVPLRAAEGEVPAWAMVELQGEIQRDQQKSSPDTPSFDIGTLSTSSTVRGAL